METTIKSVENITIFYELKKLDVTLVKKKQIIGHRGSGFQSH